ncbi:hypothetical protein WG66_005349 [Moniliophthora roreri]|nr:hypothetical protein WG66_005349 [Moniliophthora roreri]
MPGEICIHIIIPILIQRFPLESLFALNPHKDRHLEERHIPLRQFPVPAIPRFPEKQGYPLWSPQPNTELPEEYIREGIRIGDVGIVHHDTPFDFLFNITYAANHPINHRGVPKGFTPVELRDIDITRVPEYRENDSHVVGPKNTLLKEEVLEEDLQEGFSRSYRFTSSNDQGAILMLPEGSTLSKLESKAIFRAYAKKNALAWFSYAKECRGREFPSGTDPSLYLVTGWEKCPAWGISSFCNSFYKGTTVNLPFNVLSPEEGRHNVYSWGRSVLCQSRCHPSIKFSGKSLPNQTVFIRGFKISKRSKKEFKVRDIMGTRVTAEKILDLPFEPSTGAGPPPSNASEASNDQGHGSNSGGRHRTIALSEELGDGEDMDIDDDSPQEASSFHPCDLINDFAYNVASSLKRTIPDITISHDDDWISMIDALDASLSLPNAFDFLMQLSYNLTVVVDPNAIYTEMIPPTVAMCSNCRAGTVLWRRHLNTHERLCQVCYTYFVAHKSLPPPLHAVEEITARVHVVEDEFAVYIADGVTFGGGKASNSSTSASPRVLREKGTQSCTQVFFNTDQSRVATDTDPELLQCRRKKLLCDREVPCSNCVVKGEECKQPGSSPPALPSPPARSSPPALSSPSEMPLPPSPPALPVLPSPPALSMPELPLPPALPMLPSPPLPPLSFPTLPSPPPMSDSIDFIDYISRPATPPTLESGYMEYDMQTKRGRSSSMGSRYSYRMRSTSHSPASCH